MRIAVSSDLHLDRAGHLTRPDAIEALAREIARERPDLLVLAGDLAHGLDNFKSCVASFRSVAPRLAVLAGNHDVWRDERLGLSSLSLWEQHLPGCCAELGASWLEGETLRLGSVAVVGSMAWYDYSAVDPEQAHHAAFLPSLKPMLSNDANRIDWPYRDPEMANLLGDALLARLDAVQNEPSVDAIAVITHVPVLEGQMVRKRNNPNWGVSNAFFGNLSLGARLLERSKVRLVVSGHTHLGRDGSLEQPGGAVRYAVIGSDYGAPAFRVFELSALKSRS
jgi:predicted phosphodiesterase